LNLAGYHITIGNATDVGKVRVHNEDYMAHFDTGIGYCVIVCDGMGGHAAGEVASQNSIISIQQFLQDPKNEDPDIPLVLKNAIEFANYQLKEMVNSNQELKGMGTTCVLALIKDDLLYTAHVGDSRIYLIRNASIKQITKDHSPVQNLVDNGVLTEEEAQLSDKKNEILKAIGVFDKADPTVTETPIEILENDKILLCSDGLTAHVSKELILEIVQSGDDIQKISLKLTEQANEAGGSDNITVQLIHYSGKPGSTKRRSSFRKALVVFIFLLIAGSFSFLIYKNNYLGKEPVKVKDNPGDTLKKLNDSLKLTPISIDKRSQPTKK